MPLVAWCSGLQGCRLLACGWLLPLAPAGRHWLQDCRSMPQLSQAVLRLASPTCAPLSAAEPAAPAGVRRVPPLPGQAPLQPYHAGVGGVGWGVGGVGCVCVGGWVGVGWGGGDSRGRYGA